MGSMFASRNHHHDEEHRRQHNPETKRSSEVAEETPNNFNELGLVDVQEKRKHVWPLADGQHEQYLAKKGLVFERGGCLLIQKNV